MNTLKKIFYTLKNEGIYSLYFKSKRVLLKKLFPNYYYHSINIEKILQMKTRKYILFVTGEEKNPTTVYRCEVPIESLNINGKRGDVIYYKFLTPELLKHYEYIVWYRMPLNKSIKKYVDILRKRNEKIIYSIDDLLFDKSSLKSLSWFKKLSKNEQKRLLKNADGILQFLKIADLGIASTENLAEKMRKYVKKRVLVLENTYSQKDYRLSKKLYKKYPKKITLGFFSGSYTHNGDLELIADDIAKILKQHKNVHLLIGGRVKIPKPLEIYKNQINLVPFLNLTGYIKALSKITILLNPLVINEHNLSKSEIKIIHGGLLARVAVATKTPAFEKIINHGKNGFLIKQNQNWYDVLNKLLSKNDLEMERFGKNLRNDIITKYNPGILGQNLIYFLELV